jgi:hypothetical protein
VNHEYRGDAAGELSQGGQGVVVVETTDSAPPTVAKARLDDVSSALEQLGEVLAADGDLGALLQRTSELVIRAVPGARMASITILQDGEPATVACTDDRVYYLDADQYRSGAGPCLEAADTRKVVRVDLDEASDRWPTFTAAARKVGVVDYLAAPLYVGNAHAGALNLYSDVPHGFDEIDSALVEIYANAAEAVLTAFARYQNARTLATNLREALESRAVIDQAKGVLMSTHQIDADQAFALLARRSQQENVKVRELAVQIMRQASGGSTLV